MSTSNQTFKQYSFSQHGEIYQILENIFQKFGVNYYLIGANARDVQLYKAGVTPNRGTGDIDFAVMVPDMGVYDAIFDELTNSGFRKAKEVYRLYFEKTGAAIDLLPYGEIEQESTVNFTERNITMSVLGFKEVGEEMEIFRIEEEGFEINVSPIEGLFILKLISWSKNPEARTRDLVDISQLLEIAWVIYEEEAFEKHNDLFEIENFAEEFDVNNVAAQILGRKMRIILDANTLLKHTIISILEDSVEEKEKPKNPEFQLAIEMDKSIEEVQNILKIIIKGIFD